MERHRNGLTDILGFHLTVTGIPILGFHCHAIENKIANYSTQKVQNLGNKRTYICKTPRPESGLCDISYGRYSEKRFIQIYKVLPRDAMICPFVRATNMAVGNLQKHLFLSFPTSA